MAIAINSILFATNSILPSSAPNQVKPVPQIIPPTTEYSA